MLLSYFVSIAHLFTFCQLNEFVIERLIEHCSITECAVEYTVHDNDSDVICLYFISLNDEPYAEQTYMLAVQLTDGRTSRSIRPTWIVDAPRCHTLTDLSLIHI